MEHESPIMKAWREFALADPEDCDREWEAYLALVSGKETASVSPPTNTTSTLHSCAHGPAVVSASPSTRSTASLHAPGSAISTTTPATPASASTSTRDSSPTTKDDLSPEARLIYDYIVGNSDEFASRDGLSPGARRYYDYLVGGSAPPASASTNVSTNHWVPTELEAVHDAVDDNTDLTAPAPTNCLSECPSRGVSHLEVALLSSATATSCTTTGSVSESERCCFDPEPGVAISTPTSALCLLKGGASTSRLTGDSTALNVAPMAVDINDTDLADVVPVNCWSECLSYNDVVSVSMPNSYATQTLADCSCCGIEKSPSLLAEAYEVFNEVPTATGIVPWPPPSWTRAKSPLIRGQDLFQHAQQKCGKDFIVKDSQGNWNANWIELRQARHPFERMKVVKLKPPWPFLGACKNLPRGNLLSSLGFLTVKDNNNPGTNWCLDDLLWKLPSCWSYSQCVRPAKAILDVFSWPWVTSDHAEVQFQFSNTLIPVKCDLARVHFPLSRTAQLNVGSHCEASLILIVYCGYPFATNKAMTTSILTAKRFTVLTQIGVLPLQTRIKRPPWPPQWSTCIQNIHHLDVHDMPPLLPLLVESVEYIRGRIGIRFCRFSSQVAELFLFCCVAYSIPNLHCTMDTKQISGDLLYFTTTELQWEANLTVITFYLGVQCVPLQPTAFKWSDHSCYDTNYLLATCYSMFSDVEVPSLVHAEREGLFPFCSVGKASLYSYGTAKFQWEIAWPPTTLIYSIHYGLHLYLTLGCSIAICYLEVEMICATIRSVYVPHLHWDPGGFSRRWLGVKTKFRKFAWLLVGSYLASSESGRSEMVTLKESMPPLNQLMLHVYHTFPPGTLIEVGFLNDSLVQDWLICLSGHIIQYGFEVAQWKIAWSFLWEYFDAGNKSRHFIPAATLTYPVWYFSWDPGIWALLCFCELFTQVVAKGSIMVEAPTYCYYPYIVVFLGQASSAMTTSSTWCKSTSTTSTTSVTVTTMTRIIKTSHVPWDPGGSTWHRLEGKPNFKDGGLSTTCRHGLAWAATMGLGLLRSEMLKRHRRIYSSRRQEGTRLGTDRTAASAEAWLGVCVWRACLCSFFLLDPLLPSPFLNSSL